MSAQKSYVIERLTKVIVPTYGTEVMTEQGTEAWVEVGVVESDKVWYHVMEDWVDTWGDSLQAGQYRIVEQGPFCDTGFRYQLKPSWKLEEVKRDAVAV